MKYDINELNKTGTCPKCGNELNKMEYCRGYQDNIWNGKEWEGCGFNLIAGSFHKIQFFCIQNNTKKNHCNFKTRMIKVSELSGTR